MEFVVTVLVTMATLQYVGVFGPSEGIEFSSLDGVGLTLPLCTYLLTVVCANSRWLSQWSRTVKDNQ